MLKSTSTFALMATLSLTLTACGSFDREAGADIDEGGFGNPTMTNTLISTGELAAVEGIARRFEDEVNSSVNFAFNSAALDGASKQVLMRQASWIRQFQKCASGFTATPTLSAPTTTTNHLVCAGRMLSLRF